MTQQPDVVVIGGGLAGLTFSRQLLLETDLEVLVLERGKGPPRRQKVGESTVQLGGHYLGKVLELEEHLLHEHFLKYNLRFHWPVQGALGAAHEEFSQGFIRALSNIPSYQVDRNVLERELLARNQEDDRFAWCDGVSDLEIDLDTGSRHRLSFRCAGEERSLTASWLVDASGRHRVLARKLGLERPSPIGHGSSFLWVNGLIDVERLTARSARQRRLCRSRSVLGHLPQWLSTNHFCGEGWWLWIIPLRGKTSLGLVFDREQVRFEEVASAGKLRDWICRHLPLFEEDLRQREVVGHAGFRDYAYDCTRTLSAERWAMSGESGRFSDPLYSPGTDLMALHNTLILDAIRAPAGSDLEALCRRHEQLLRVLYEAYLPSYTLSYDALGDRETFILKYSFELAIYFAFYVFPFVNELFTERRFVTSYLRRFARLGPLNRQLQGFLSGYFQWKKRQGIGDPEPAHFDFTAIPPLARAQELFYRVGVDVDEARALLDEQLANLEEMADWIVAWVGAAVTGGASWLDDRGLATGYDLEANGFDPRLLQLALPAPSAVPWSFDPRPAGLAPRAAALAPG